MPEEPVTSMPASPVPIKKPKPVIDIRPEPTSANLTFAQALADLARCPGTTARRRSWPTEHTCIKFADGRLKIVGAEGRPADAVDNLIVQVEDLNEPHDWEWTNVR